MSGRSSAPGQTLHIMDCEEIAEYLASLGVSSQGIHAIRENQVDGEMFMDLTENDIKDLFSIFKDRHLVRKILQGKDNRLVHHSQQIRETDFTSQPIRSLEMVSGPSSEPISIKGTSTNQELELGQRNSRQYKNDDKDTVMAREQIDLLQSYVKAINPYAIYPKNYQGQTTELQPKHSDPYKSVACTRAHMLTNQDVLFPYKSSQTSSTCTDSKGKTGSELQSNISTHGTDTSQNTVKHLFKPTSQTGFRNPVSNSTDNPKPSFHSAISHFIHNSSYVSARDRQSEEPSDYTRDSSSWCHNIDEDQDDSRFIPSVLTYRLTQFTGLELMSRKAKQGRPNEAQRLGQMVIREASSRAGIWDDPPCLQLLSGKQKQLFFEYSFTMAPNLREYKDLLWKRLGEALLNRRKYLRDKVLGKRGKRLGDSSTLQEADLDCCESPEPAEDFEDQIPDTSTSPVHRQHLEDSNMRGRGHWNRGPSSTVSRSDVSEYPVLVVDDSPDEDEKQAYPDSTMDNQYSLELENDYKLQVKIDLESAQAKRKRSFTDTSAISSRNLSLLSSAACSALLKEEAEQGFRQEVKQRRMSDYWMDYKDDEVETRPDPPQDIEKVNLHKRLFLSKYDSSAKHHHSRADIRRHEEDRKPIIPLCDPPPQSQAELSARREDPSEASVSPEHDAGFSGQWDSFVMEEVPHMRIYSTIDRGISHYSGEELLAKKSKQGKPSEAQRLGQQVIRESAMMAKLWQEVPQSIRSITEEQKKTFYQCAFTLAPNLIRCRDMLWRRLGEALQNRRKYVRDRSLGKRPTKREQRLMKESLQHQESESDSQASLSSIQDIENIVRIKSENPDTCFLKP